MTSDKLAAGSRHLRSSGCFIERRHVDLARVSSALCRS
ncbi:putative leader peptide [Jatrophihabitans sp. DSM 45814]